MNDEQIKVLLIDGEDEQQQMPTRELFSGFKAGGYHFDRISDYACALAEITAERHHVCLVNCRQQGERRRGAERFIRDGREAGSRVPIIVLVGRNPSDLDYEAMDSGSADYLLIDETNLFLLERTIRRAVDSRRAEDASRAAEVKFRTVLENSRDIIYQFNLKTRRFDYMSPAAKELSGYAAEEFIERGFAFSNSLVHPSDLKSIKDYVRGVSRSESDVDADRLIEYRLKTKENGYRWFSENRAVIRDESSAAAAIIAVARDITDRKQAEATVRLQKTLLEAQSESSRDGILVVGADGEIIFHNRRFVEIWEIPESILAIGTNDAAMESVLDKLTCPEDFLKTASYLKQQPQAKNQEELVLRDGRIIDLYTAPVADANENYYGRICYFRNITARKHAEDMLRRSESNLAAAQRITHLGSWEIDLLDFRRINNNKVYWSDEVYRIFGYEPGQIDVSINRYFESVHPAERRRVRKAFFEAVGCRKDLNIEFPIVLPDGGGERILHGRAEVLYDEQSGKPLKFIGTVQDITARKQTESALSEANERAIREYERLLDRLAQLAESLGSARDLQAIYRALHSFALVSVPCTGFFISLYDAAREVRIAAFGCDGGEEFDVSLLPPMPMTDSPNSRAVSTRSIVIENDFQKAMENRPVVNIGLDKNPALPQSCLIAPMSVMGRVVGAVEAQSTQPAAYTQEHSTAMRMAANLAANAIENVRLLEQECEKDEQLRQSQKLESVGRLAGGIAHDFNNMLTAINGYSELILRKIGKDDPLRRSIIEIKKAGERSSALTHQLLAFSRQQILQLRVLNLNDVIVDTAEMLERLIGEDVEILTVLDPRLSGINSDPGQLTQVIMNLAVNARDAMPDGGTLVIETKNVYLDDEFAARNRPTKPGSYVLLSVKDTGTGMDAETRAHVFEPFFTTKAVGAGTGLGLATVYGIVKQSGGYIWIDTAVGGGSTFRIYLPTVSERAGTMDTTTESLIEPQKGEETILLVEDEEIVRKLSRQILESCGYRVIEAGNGVEALEMDRRHGGQIDLLLTDVVMPQMGGRELAEKLTELRPRLRVLFTSGYTSDSTVRHGINHADINFIQKPFTFESLADKVRMVLDA